MHPLSIPIPKLKKPRLLPLFIEAATAASASLWQIRTFTRNQTPLECQIVSTSPHFIISDRFNTAVCDFTQEAIVAFKKLKPLLQLKDLVGQFLILKDYAPCLRLDLATAQTLRLSIYAFRMVEQPRASADIVGHPKPLLEDPNMESSLGILRSFDMRTLLHENDLVVDGLEKVFMTPHSVCLASPVVCKPKQPAGGHTGRIDDLGQHIVDYSNMEQVEREATKRAAQLLADEQEARHIWREQRKEFHRRQGKARCVDVRALTGLLKKNARTESESQTLNPASSPGLRRLASPSVARVPASASASATAKGSEPEVPTRLARDKLKDRGTEREKEVDAEWETEREKEKVKAKAALKARALGLEAEGEKERSVAKGRGSKPREITKQTLQKFLHWQDSDSRRKQTNTDVAALLSKSQPSGIRVEMHSVPGYPFLSAFVWTVYVRLRYHR